MKITPIDSRRIDRRTGMSRRRTVHVDGGERRLTQRRKG